MVFGLGLIGMIAFVGVNGLNKLNWRKENMSEEEIIDIGELIHSCKISINAKGNWSGELKIYGSSPESAMELALKKAKELEVIIKEKNGL